jgi:23S rRNA (cytosine1962-C5)-methyltransferase
MQSVLLRRVSPHPRREVQGRSAGAWLRSEDFGELAASHTDAHRIFSSATGWIERFAGDALISYQDEEEAKGMLAGLDSWAQSNACTFERVFERFLPPRSEDRRAPVLLRGDPQRSRQGVVEENGIRFGVDFSAGYSTGLFIDQRANRAFLRRAKMKRVLNTFAYTCSFSVVGAIAGAETISIDLSRKSLARGEENFALNGLDPRRHRFLHDDVFAVLPRLARKGDRFDAIILDPPTFSRGEGGRRFQVERDFEKLLLAALDVAECRALLLLSTNCTRLSRTVLERTARFCLKTARRSATFHLEPPLPDVPAEFSPATIWMLMTS